MAWRRCVEQLALAGYFMFSLTLPNETVTRHVQHVAVGETMKPAKQTPERSSLPKLPARLADGLDLGSGPCKRLPASFAPS